MKQLTLKNICAAVGGVYYGDTDQLDREVSAVTIDSRKVTPDSLFIAVVGNRSDGHDYILSAYERQALCCLSERVLPQNSYPYIVVPSTYQALKDLAEYYLSQLSVKVIGVTGSVGKTSTKEMIASVLSQKYRVLKTDGNFNNEIGLPLTIFRLREEHEIAVLEMGISEFGEMSRLTKIAKPHVVVITNIGQCHLENLKTRDGILKAKTEIFEGLRDNGAILLNGDDDKLATIGTVRGITPRFYTLQPEQFAADSRYTGLADAIAPHGLLGTACQIHLKQKNAPAETFSVSIPIPGDHMVYNALAGALAGQVFGLTDHEIKAGIEALTPVGGRNHIFQSGSYTIIDDCYNANPVSMRASIDVVCRADGRSVCILGDMFELGENEKQLHYETGQYLGRQAVDVLITVGSLSRELARGAAETGSEHGLEIYSFHTLDELLRQLEQTTLLKPNDTILVKASHGMQFSRIIEFFEKTEAVS